MPELADVVEVDRASAAPDDTLAAASERMYDLQVEAVAVLVEGTLVGIFTERDLVRACAGAADPRTDTVERWMTEAPEIASPSDEAGEALRTMLRRRFRHLPVVGDDGVVGIVSLTNLAAALNGH